MLHTSYLEQAFDKVARKAVIRELCKNIRSKKVKFDTVVFTGISGAMIAPSVADKLGKHIICVRKGGDGTHSYHNVEG